MSDSASNRELDKILAEYLGLSQAGSPPDRHEFLKRHRGYADDLESFFAFHDQIKAARPAKEDVTLPLTPPSAEDATLAPNHIGSDAATIPPTDPDLETATIPQSPDELAPAIGTKVRYFGDYELIEEIARGGMGVVYKARQTSLNRIVALKMILAGQLAGDEDVQRFHAEAEAAANLDHPGIVPIYEVGEHGGQHYFSMGFVEGESLSEKIKDGPLPPRQAAEYAKKVAVAMAFAHERGVIHRDLKPANVLLDRNDEPRVTDFGLAKKVEDDSGLTATGQILGTPGYMPPEQASGKTNEITESADVYSLGAILYALLTARPPFQADNPLDTLLQVLELDPVAPSTLNPKAVQDLETICLKCLEKDARNRYSSAGDLARELERFLQGEPILARPISPLARAWRWCRRRPTTAGLIATGTSLLLALSMGGPWIAIQQRNHAYQRALTQVDALRSAAPEGVPYLIDSLQPARDAVLRRLLQVFHDESADRTPRFHAAIALLTLSGTNTDVIDYLVSQISDARPADCANIVMALSNCRDVALQTLADVIVAAADSRDWTLKARLTIVALHLGDIVLGADMLQYEERPDPIQRTMFLETFPKCHGDLTELAEQLQDTSDPALRSGISLAVARVEDIGDKARQTWREVFAEWYVNQPDAGTHSATGWALRTWQLELPKIPPTTRQEAGQDWMLTPTGLTLLRIPAGEFARETGGGFNQKGKQQTVRITHDFFIADREITVGLFQQFIEDADYDGAKPEAWQGGREEISPSTDYPAQLVNWYDAVMFCNWLSHREGLKPCYERTGEKEKLKVGSRAWENDAWRLIDEANGYRLPSEAQWEYACRAGTTTRFAFGEDDAWLSGYGLHQVNSAAACGTKLCSAWGLFDMHGNVLEWCGDYSGPKAFNRDFGEESVVFNPIGPDGGPARVSRGGNWMYTALFSESSRRFPLTPMTRLVGVGLRVARVPNGRALESGNQ